MIISSYGTAIAVLLIYIAIILKFWNTGTIDDKNARNRASLAKYYDVFSISDTKSKNYVWDALIQLAEPLNVASTSSEHTLEELLGKSAWYRTPLALNDYEIKSWAAFDWNYWAIAKSRWPLLWHVMVALGERSGTSPNIFIIENDREPGGMLQTKTSVSGDKVRSKVKVIDEMRMIDFLKQARNAKKSYFYSTNYLTFETVANVSKD